MKAALPFRRALLVLVAAALLGTGPATADPVKLKIDIPDPDPELERQSLQVPEGWEITLFASDPLIAKPIQMNFDPAGRLWVATSSTYPQIKPGQPAEDKIVVLEDRDGDGRADASTMFADRLLIPTGVAPGDGGAYVANSTELLHLKDTDGDGRADTSRVLLSGFGTEDTHHILHTFRWGPEGSLYFNQSVYIHTHLETPWGVRRLLGGGIWRLRPESMRVEVFARGWVNAWGHQFDRWGQSFVTDGAGGEGINYVVPDASYVGAVGTPRILHGLNPGQPKYCSHEILSGRHVPPDLVGSIITNDFRGHRIARFTLADDDSGFSATRVADLVTSTHVAFRPVDLKLGPDGAIYIADFYNPIINHGEVDFRDPRRDLTHGRIWRLRYKDRPLVERPRLVGAQVEALLAALQSPEDYTRSQARRLLKERGAKDVLPALAAWVKQLDPADPQFEHHRLEALWVCQAFDAVDPQLLRAVLASADFRARAAAVRVLYHCHERLPQADLLSWLTLAVADEHPRVRLEAVCALRQLGDASAVDLAMLALDKPTDTFLEYTLWQTAHDLAPVWLPAYAAGRINFGGNIRQAVFALRSAATREAVVQLVRLFQEGDVSPVDEADVLELIARQGGPPELQVLFELALNGHKLPALQRARLLEMLAKAAQRGARPSGDLARVEALFAAPDAGVREEALRAAGAWRLETARPMLTLIAKGADAPETMRRAAIDGLASLGGPASIEVLASLTADQQPPAMRVLAAAALAGPDVKLAAERAVAVLATGASDAQAGPLFDAFIRRAQGPPALIAALAGHSLPPAIAGVGVRQAQAAGRDMRALVAALNAAGQLSQGLQQLSAEEKNRLLADVSTAGNAARGEAVFRKANQQCLQCHAIGGAGGQVGPDLVSIGASAPLDYLLESLLEPNKKIKEGYHTTVITTANGQVLAGLLVRKTDRELLLRDATSKELTIAADDVESQAVSPNSLMPTGQLNTLRRDEVVDLVRFLSELGKEGPYQLSKARLVRSWQVLDTARLTAPHTFDAQGTRLASDSEPSLPWQPAVSTVAGALPLEELPEVVRWKQQFFSFARCQVDVPRSGQLGLRLADASGLEMWVDGAPLKPAAELTLNLAPGAHTIALAIDRKARQSPLRIELVEPPPAK